MNKEETIKKIRQALKEYFSSLDYYYHDGGGTIYDIKHLEKVSDIDINAMMERIEDVLKEDKQ
jgi:hypothetical protein